MFAALPLVCCVMQRRERAGSSDYEYRPGGSAYNSAMPE
jgi:hypothetical protein